MTYDIKYMKQIKLVILNQNKIGCAVIGFMGI